MSIKIISLVFESRMPALKTDEGLPVRAGNIRLVLLALADHANDAGERAYPGLDRLCSMTRLARQTVVSALNALRTHGYIRLDGRSARLTSNYSIMLDRLSGVQTLDSPEVQSLDSEESNGWTETSPTTGQNPSFNRPLKPLVVNDGEAEIFRAYEREIGPLTPGLREAIAAWLREAIPRQWITEAINLAARNNSRRWNYVEAILKNWKTHGKKTGKEFRNAPNQKDPRRLERPTPREPGPEELALAKRINALHDMWRAGLASRETG